MGILDFLGGSDNGFQTAQETLLRNRGLYDQIGLPEYDEWNPELYRGDSTQFELTTEDPLYKSSQMQLLSKLAGLSETGLSAEDEAAFGRARGEATQMAKRGTEAALADAARRGASGSGLEFAMREQANQESAGRANQANLERAAAAARERALYTQAYGDALSGARGQDLNARQANTDIINRFNQANTQNRNAINQANVDSRNDAFKYNQGLKDKRFSNELGRADRVAGMNDKEMELQLAQEEQRRKRRGAMVGLVGAGAGAMVGGPTGAMVGSQVGQTVGGY
jgi:hypothetical protein